MQLELHNPQDGYYEGTRFDRSGVFKSLTFKGVELCGQWFERYSPKMHDAVCGPVDEFSVIQCGPCWLKPGVGLLASDGEPYDRFELYDIVDPGRWNVESHGQSTIFRHYLEDYYIYTKGIHILSENAFEIRHELKPLIPWYGSVYNHNFFTMGKLETGPSRCIDFPFLPDGSWRDRYDSVCLTDEGIRFSRTLKPGESVYNSGIHRAGEQGMPYEMTLREGPLSIHIKGDVPVTHTVLWANHRIVCVEPYNQLTAVPGETLDWTIRYEIHFKEQ